MAVQHPQDGDAVGLLHIVQNMACIGKAEQPFGDVIPLDSQIGIVRKELPMVFS